MPWEGIVERVAGLRRPTLEGAGRASLPVRVMVGLLHLKYAYNLFDYQVLERWLESLYVKYFTGEVHFQHELPCDPSSQTVWRNRLDEAGSEELLGQTVEVGKTLKAIRPRELRVASIDTTVQEKNVAHPTDRRLLEVERSKFAERAAPAGIKLRQSYARTGLRLNRQAGRYALARSTSVYAG